MNKKEEKKGHIKFKIDISLPLNISDIILLFDKFKAKNILNRETKK